MRRILLGGVALLLLGGTVATVSINETDGSAISSLPESNPKPLQVLQSGKIDGASFTLFTAEGKVDTVCFKVSDPSNAVNPAIDPTGVTDCGSSTGFDAGKAYRYARDDGTRGVVWGIAPPNTTKITMGAARVQTDGRFFTARIDDPSAKALAHHWQDPLTVLGRGSCQCVMNRHLSP